VVSAEKGEFVGPPQLPKIASRAAGRDEGDVNHAQCSGIFEQQGEQVALVEETRAPFITQRAVLLVAYVQAPGVAGHFEIIARGLHVAEELVSRDPSADRALGEAIGNGLPSRRYGG